MAFHKFVVFLLIVGIVSSSIAAPQQVSYIMEAKIIV